MLRILYVTAAWSGLADVLYQGSTPRGMPAFIRPLKGLIEGGHQVDLLVGAPEERQLNLGVDWLRPQQIHPAPWQPDGPRWDVRRLLRFGLAVRRRLSETQYDFVYAQGSLGTLGAIEAQRAGVPCGQRLYGVNYLINEFPTEGLDPWGRAGVWLRHPLHYQAFSSPKAFLLVTNDGTRADQIYRQIGDPGTPLLFWLNGVDRPSDLQPAELPAGIRRPFLLYPGRINHFKRQHLAVELVHRLRERGAAQLQLLFAGHDGEADYRHQLDRLVEQLGLSDSVRFLGPIEHKALLALMPAAAAVLSFYEVSNLGNVALEALATGSVLLSLSDGSLDAVVRDEESALLVDGVEQAVDAVQWVLRDSEVRERLQRGARTTAETQLLSWEERVAREIAVIEDAAAGRKVEG